MQTFSHARAVCVASHHQTKLNRKKHHVVCKHYEGVMFKRSVTKSLKIHVGERQKWLCNWCRESLEDTFQVDHIRPLWHGGDNSPINLQALCPNCHARKSKLEANMMPRKKKTANNSVVIYCPLCKGQFSPYFNHFCGLMQRIGPIAKEPVLRNWDSTVSSP